MTKLFSQHLFALASTLLIQEPVLQDPVQPGLALVAIQPLQEFKVRHGPGKGLLNQVIGPARIPRKAYRVAA